MNEDICKSGRNRRKTYVYALVGLRHLTEEAAYSKCILCIELLSAIAKIKYRFTNFKK